MFQVQSITGLKSMYPMLTNSVFIAFLETLVGAIFCETDEMAEYNFGKKLYEQTLLDVNGWVSIFRAWGTGVSGHYLLELGGDPTCSGAYVVVKETHLPSSMLGFSQVAGKYDAGIRTSLKNALAGINNTQQTNEV